MNVLWAATSKWSYTLIIQRESSMEQQPKAASPNKDP